MKCKWIPLGKIKLCALLLLGNRLQHLQPRRQRSWVDFQYRIIRGFLEMVSSGEVYEIISSESYSCSHSTSRTFLKKGRSGFAANAVIVGHNDRQVIEKRPLPDLALTEFRDVVVTCGSDFVLDRITRIAVNDYCADNKNDNNGYEDSTTYFQGGKVAILRKAKRCLKFDAGVRIDGKYSNNYYHNVYENLIRLLAIEECNNMISEKVPLIIDRMIIDTPSLNRIFDILSKNLNRSYITLDEGECAEVGQLYCVSAINYLVPIHIGPQKGGIEDYVFDRNYVMRMRERLLAYKSTGNYPKRIFLTRKSATHRKINEDDILKVLLPLGFEIVAPEKFSFEEQMAIFNNAECIIGCSGAAFTNVIFCSDKCTVICLDRYGYAYPVFTAPACFSGARMLNFQSDAGTTSSKIHSDFVINADSFSKFINSIIPKDTVG